ncbi:MAG: methylenetetrahydrofolate reductase C-terminal domain-containing protein [Chloroflexi bacterium]|nr:methylenetetrahydrofolate reductase C-terminal domain-containing protein [Chloroflexota bacterium]
MTFVNNINSPPSRITLRDLFSEPDRFIFAVEIETTRGLAMEEPANRMARLAHNLVDFADVDVLGLTDNPGGNPNNRPEALGLQLHERGQEVIVNVSCKDYNRNGIESRLWALGSYGFDAVLALTGDYPTAGYAGQAKPVFDIDSVALLEMIRRLNEGYPPADRSVGAQTATIRTSFFPGTSVSPFKVRESEYLPQLFKLAYKIRSGAQWAITQIGYDSRKMDELQRYMALKQLNIPVMGSVFILSAPAARFFHRWGVPGINASSELVELANKQAKSEDKGRAFFHELAAKQMAILKGLGYRGVYLSGRPSLRHIETIIGIEKSFGQDDWKDFARELQFPLPEEFYYFEQDPDTGLASSQVNQNYVASKSRLSRTRKRLTQSPAFTVGKLTHDVFFDAKAPGKKLGELIYKGIDKTPKLVQRFAHCTEQAAKFPVYGCHDCGDCSLPDIAYLCPESQCAKNQRNGPCGGTKDVRCEVLDKDCIWSRAYDRLKSIGQEEQMLERPVVFKNGALQGTSAWSNTLLERDHHSSNSEGQKSR